MNPDVVTEEVAASLESATRTGVRVAGLRIASYAIGFVASALIVRALGPTGRGLVAVPVAVSGISMAVGNVGFSQAEVYLASRGVSVHRLWASATLVACLLGSTAWIVIVVLLAVGGSGVFGELPSHWVVLTVAQVPILLQTVYWYVLLQIEGHLRRAVIANVAGVLAHALLAALLYSNGELTPFRALALLWVLNGTAWVVTLAFCAKARIVGWRFDAAIIRRGLAFGLKAHLGIVFLFLLLRVDQLFVQHLLGFRALGLYSLAVMLAELLWLFTEPIAAAMVPYQVRSEAGDDLRLTFAGARTSLTLSLVVCAVVWAIAPIAIRLVYGEEFEGMVWALRLLLPGVVALSLQRPLLPFLLKAGRPWLITGLGLSALAVNVVGVLLLVPRMGISGASIASSVCYAAFAAAYVRATRSVGSIGWRDLRPRVSDLQLLGRSLIPRGLGPRRATN